MPEIVGKIVGVRVARRRADVDDPYGMVLEVRERSRIPGTNDSLPVAGRGWKMLSGDEVSACYTNLGINMQA